MVARFQQFFRGHSIRQALAAISIVVLSAVTSPSSLAQSTLSPAAKEALQEGITAAKNQNWDAAQKHFDAAYDASPGASEILFNMGLLNDLKGGVELVASAWYRAYLAAVPNTPNRTQIEARLIDLHASVEARAAKYMAVAKEIAKQLVPTVSVSAYSALPGFIDSDCDGGFGDLLKSAMFSGDIESIDEVIDWFQGNECQNYFRYSVIAAAFALEQPRVASRYIGKMSGPWKVSALNLFAAVKWSEGDKASAIKLVEEAEVVATQLLKGSGKSALLEKYNALRLRSEMAVAWCLVGKVAKARGSLERIDPNTGAEPELQNGDSIRMTAVFGLAFVTVAATLVSTGNEKEAKATLRAIVSKIRHDWTREYVQRSFEGDFEDLKNTPREDLIRGLDENFSVFYQLRRSDEHVRLMNSLSVKTARESDKTEQDYWIDWAKGDLILFGDVYRDGEKFLATDSGLDVENTVAKLSKGSDALLLGSRTIKEIAEAWGKEGAGSAQ